MLGPVFPAAVHRAFVVSPMFWHSEVVYQEFVECCLPLRLDPSPTDSQMQIAARSFLRHRHYYYALTKHAAISRNHTGGAPLSLVPRTTRHARDSDRPILGSRMQSCLLVQYVQYGQKSCEELPRVTLIIPRETYPEPIQSLSPTTHEVVEVVQLPHGTHPPKHRYPAARLAPIASRSHPTGQPSTQL